MPTAAALSHLKFRHLLLIQALSELGTLRKAAVTLNISQPAATAMLTDLEGLIGFSLFERSHRGVHLTERGSQLLGTVRRLTGEFNEFNRAIEQVRNGHAPALRLGVVPQAYTSHLPLAIARFRSEGGTRLRTEEGTATQLMSHLLAGQLDGVVGRMPASGLPVGWDLSGVCFEHLYAEQICVIAGASYQELPAPPYGFAWLAARDWVLQRRDSSVRAALNEAFMRAGVTPPTPIVETTNYNQSLALAARMAVFTVAPRSVAAVQQQLGLVRILDHDLRVLPMQVSFIYRRSSQSNHHLEAFRACLRAVVADAGAEHLASVSP